jgi:hypothetical protein
MKPFCAKKLSFFRKMMVTIVLAVFSLNFVFDPAAFAQSQLLPNTTMVSLTKHFEPPTLLGMTIHPENPFFFEFLVDRGQDQLTDENLTATSDKLVKYFLSAMTVPDAESWVNLSPYEKDRIMPDQLSATEMGKTMLEQDYLLKQLSSSLTSPEQALGKRFWDAVKTKAFERFGTTDLPMDTFNKVWIVPQKALILEKDGFVVIGESSLKIMLEEDYVALSNQKDSAKSLAPARDEALDVNKLSSQIFREMILPELEKEINEGSTFAPVRQIYHAVILATWFKKNLRESLLGQVYVDKNKIAGIDIAEKDIKQRVYRDYLNAFQQGAYNLIKEEIDLVSKESLPRKYFSGGTSFASSPTVMVSETMDRPSTQGRRSLKSIEATMAKNRIASASVQLADSQNLGNVLRGNVIASSTIQAGSRYYFGKEDKVNRGIDSLQEAYRVSSFLDQRKDKGPLTILLVGGGYGVAALQMALRYPNLTIWMVNKEKGVRSIAESIKRVDELDHDKYVDSEITQALNRIKVIEPLDIEDDGAREKMLATTPKVFDAVIVETNVTLYFADQIRTIEKLFNDLLKVDGLLTFEFTFPQVSLKDSSELSKSLALEVLETAFSRVGNIVFKKDGTDVSYAVLRNAADPVAIPLKKDWQKSAVLGGQGNVPRVFLSVYDLVSSSALTVQDLQRNYILLGTVAALKDMKVAEGESISSRQVLAKLADLYPEATVEESAMTRFFSELGLQNNPSEPEGGASWVIDPAFAGNLKEQFILSAIKASLVLTVGEMYSRLTLPNVAEEAALMDGFMDEWPQLAADWKAGKIVNPASLGLTLDSKVFQYFFSDDNREFVTQLLNDVTRDQSRKLASSALLERQGREAPITSDTGVTLKKGGIDFNPALFDLQIKRDVKGVPLPVIQQDLKSINIEGLYPVIIDIQPATLQNFPLLSSLDNKS